MNSIIKKQIFIEEFVSDWLIHAGVKPNTLGFRSIRSAVRIYNTAEPTLRLTGVGGLYSQVAESVDSSGPCVERAIRHACRKIKSSGVLTMSQVTNGALIAYLSQLVDTRLSDNSDHPNIESSGYRCIANCAYRCNRTSTCVVTTAPTITPSGQCSCYTPR